MHGLMSYRRFGRARLLRSDRAERTLGRYVATELGSSSVAKWRPSGTRVRSLRSDLFRALVLCLVNVFSPQDSS
ncbi:hypothetical protein F2Q70_00035757 [Brassica cretica]|uniref:Uncharacterized protein n=1 Tax=Brassica cretica TaxID=69181 RepID=A0A8S9JV94_BRACR|nr:hypothetical protein F2Q70_00035757 [Brassica cretica]